MLDSMDMHVAPRTTSHTLPVVRNNDTGPGADTAIHTANNSTANINTANTDDDDDDDKDHMPDIETNHNGATGTIPSPTNAAASYIPLIQNGTKNNFELEQFKRTPFSLSRN
mmetsp:Transcript_21436/g.48305  ORF Transcript_21436/g.48305 Transcript_21436/m.48305 type:complete len:112 (-) Transcript_21436:833-1168(-)